MQHSADGDGRAPMWTAREWRPSAAHERFLCERPNGHLNATLYHLCEDAPDHRDLARVRAKVIIVGRSYATGLMRHAERGEGAVAETLVRHWRWIDRDIAQLRAWKHYEHEPRRDRIETIARVHGRIVRALSDATRSSVRSFVAKYLHFHAPVVPIFDQYAFREIGSWYKRVHTEAAPPGVDEDYWAHAVRHAWIVDNWSKVGLRPRTSRAIDDYAIASWNTTK